MAGFYDTAGSDPAAYGRSNDTPSSGNDYRGFRPALYFGEPVMVEPPEGDWGGGPS